MRITYPVLDRSVTASSKMFPVSITRVKFSKIALSMLCEHSLEESKVQSLILLDPLLEPILLSSAE